MERFWRWLTHWIANTPRRPDPDYDPRCRYDGPTHRLADGRYYTSCQTPGHHYHMAWVA